MHLKFEISDFKQSKPAELKIVCPAKMKKKLFYRVMSYAVEEGNAA
jgi:hypothetical protein